MLSLVAAALLMSAEALPPASGVLTLDEVTVHWRRRPFDRGYYPDAAAYRHVEGSAVILCRIRGDGTLNRCKVERQDPPHGGFGQPTVHYFTDLMVVDPVARDGTPTVGCSIRLHKDWRIDGGAGYDLH